MCRASRRGRRGGRLGYRRPGGGRPPGRWRLSAAPTIRQRQNRACEFAPICQRRCHAKFAPHPLGRSENEKRPAGRGFSRCAEEDSNLHPVIPDQALNLATRVSYASRSRQNVLYVQRSGRIGRIGRNGWMLSRIALSDRTLVISRLPRSRRATLDAVAGARSLRHHSNREPTEPRDARFSSSLAGVPTLAAETLASRRKGRDSGASPDYNAVGSAAPGCLGCGSSGRRAAVVFSDGGAEVPYINPV